jgi:2-polyprenyl-3-methyl-5-hydroxy-6-metoxy-1,4-benzoquinol methylase
VDAAEFTLAELPAPPSSVLEVGCGDGRLARALAAADYSVLAIDPEAPEGPIFRRCTIEALEERGPFDAVVASRSLHHVFDLTIALDTIAAVLRPGGAVIVDEFGWERLDARSAGRVGIALADWVNEHAHLHTAEVMLRELDARFSRRWLSWEPYLHRESRAAVNEETERRLIEAGDLQPIGLRYVGGR